MRRKVRFYEAKSSESMLFYSSSRVLDVKRSGKLEREPLMVLIKPLKKDSGPLKSQAVCNLSMMCFSIFRKEKTQRNSKIQREIF